MYRRYLTGEPLASHHLTTDMVRQLTTKKNGMPLEEILHRLLRISSIADALTPDPEDPSRTEGCLNMREEINAILSSYDLQDMEAATIDPQEATPQTATNSPITAAELAESGIIEGEIEQTVFRLSDLCKFTQVVDIDELYRSKKSTHDSTDKTVDPEHDIPNYQDHEVSLDGIKAWMTSWPVEIDLEYITDAIQSPHAHSIDTLTKDPDYSDTFKTIKHTIDTSDAYATTLFEEAHAGNISRDTHQKLAQTIFDLWETAKTIRKFDRTEFGSTARLELDRLRYNLHQALEMLLPGHPPIHDLPIPAPNVIH